MTVNIKILNLTIKNYMLDENDPIEIFDFLICFVNQIDTLKTSETQVFIGLPKVLADLTEAQFLSSLSGASRHSWIT